MGFSKEVRRGFWSKNWIFSPFVFYAKKKTKQKKQEKRCLDYKNKEFIKVQELEFFLRGSPFFGQNFEIIPYFYCRQRRQGKSVWQYSRNKKSLHDYKNKELKKPRKFRIFPKGLVHGFGQKSAIFPSFHFRQNRHEKRVSRYSKTEKTLF